jgi:hypothetical protein
MSAAEPAASCRQFLCRRSRSIRLPELPGPHLPQDPQWKIPTMSPGKATPRTDAGSLCRASCQLARLSCGARQRSNSGEAGSFAYAGDCETPFAGAAIRVPRVEVERICTGRSPTVGSPRRRSQRRRAESKRREVLPTTLFKAQWIGNQTFGADLEQTIPFMGRIEPAPEEGRRRAKCVRSCSDNRYRFPRGIK